ncbi:MAG: hypothetical protein JW774_05910 [Candidatus Aureabacteria bacterium]|nr:hypothetical protein [Candidatus Auribacterota bacterium]
MKKIIFLAGCFLYGTMAFSEVMLTGRQMPLDAAYWILNKKGKAGKGEIISNQAEVFCCLQNRTDFCFGGCKDDEGAVWMKNREKGETTLTRPPESRMIYALAYSEKEDALYCAGTHVNLGGAFWEKKGDSDWGQPQILMNSSVIYSLAVDDKDRIFAGGLMGTHGKVWIKNQGEWNHGTNLNQAKEINTLTISGNSIFAGGKKNDLSGGEWEFKGEAWTAGNPLKFSVGIYTSITAKDGTVYFGGAGNENKVIWENSGGFWNAVELKDCLALYTLFCDLEGNLYAAGWNKQRKGRLWIKKRKKDWDEGTDIENCFVIRGIC